MYVEFEFDTPPDGLEAAHLARLLLDLQHLMVMATALARPTIQQTDPALSHWLRSYKGMVEASIPQLRAATAEVAIIQQRSPLMIGLYLKEVSGILKSKVENVLRFVFE